MGLQAYGLPDDVTILEDRTKIGTHPPTGLQARRGLPEDASDKAHWAFG